MGEDIYDTCGQTITWSEEDNEFSCLCIEWFDGEIDEETIKSLALLGAAVRKAWVLESHGINREWMYIPNCIPDKVLDAIRRVRLNDVKGNL